MRLFWVLLYLAATFALSGSWGVASARPASLVAGENPRLTIPLARGWRFKLEVARTGPEADSFDDSDWAAVNVPHTWNRVGRYLPTPETHLNRTETINKTMGVGWYRLRFLTPSGLRDKRAWLQFDAASRTAEVWVNGVRVGEHQGGFSRFRFDVTAALKASGENLLAVRVDNSKPAPDSSTADVLPLAGDFFVHGGLYRPAALVLTDNVHVSMLEHGGDGLRVETTAVTGKRATVLVGAKLRNAGDKPVTVNATARLVSHLGRVAAEGASQLTVSNVDVAEFALQLDVASVRLWNGLIDPYLYTLFVEIKTADGVLLDSISRPFGIRQIHIDAKQGFFLNGQSYPLRGVGYHQDREGKGWAIDEQDVESDVIALREMGANSIRLTHYQHGQAIHDLADRYGLIVWDEIPLVSAWTLRGAATPTPGLMENARQQLRELIAQNRNHASVVSWGLANEVDFGNSLPGFVTEASATPPDPLPILRELNELAHRLDPSRPTAVATCCEGRLFAAGIEVPVTAPEADLAGANRYFGWYYGSPTELGASLDALHSKRPTQPLAVSEYGAGGATTIHTDNPWAGAPDSRGRNQPEEVESAIHEVSWAQLKSRHYLWATWLWAGFDFASTVRQEGDAEDINTKGLISYDRQIRKDAYYFYKANWSTNPTVHINGRRYINRAYPVTDVRVYSNASRTELFLNGKSLGYRKNCENRVCVWQEVRLSAGDNTIVARAVFSGRSVADTVSWAVDPETERAMRIDAGALVAGKSGNGLFGSDHFFSGGVSASLDRPANYGRPASPATIGNTIDRDIAATYRSGKFSYDLPLDNGRYKVRLTFVEPALPADERIFDVAVNDTTVLAALDVAREAGGARIALEKAFEASVSNGRLRLNFLPSKGEAMVSALQIERLP